MRFNGKVVVVTGAAQGIGKAVAKQFGREGATVVIGDMNAVAGEATASEIEREIGRRVYFRQLDVGEPVSVSAFVGFALAMGKRIDVLINNAGITRDRKLHNMSIDEFDLVMKVNVRGTFLMAHEVINYMMSQGSGVIINASSVVSRGNIGQTNYAASKAAVEAMVVTWAREYAKKGIRVNAIAPGFTDTPMTQPLRDEVKQAVIAATPLGRFMKPEEIAEAYCFLASDAASAITGQVIKVDGGFIV